MQYYSYDGYDGQIPVLTKVHKLISDFNSRPCKMFGIYKDDLTYLAIIEQYSVGNKCVHYIAHESHDHIRIILHP